MKMTSGFQPVFSKSTKTLILGTAPSVTSLKKQEYYGHVGNQFWPLFNSFYRLDPLSYAERCQKLLEFQLGLWDVYNQFQRIGSSDQSFVSTTVNTFDSHFLREQLSLIIFNGKKAATEGAKQAFFNDKLTLTCPSTSGANNAQAHVREQKWFQAYQLHEHIRKSSLAKFHLFFGHSDTLKQVVFELRQEVFVSEQQISELDEFDWHDQTEDTDYFLLMSTDFSPVATIRFQTLSSTTVQPDRFCVQSDYRMQHIGWDLLTLYELYASFHGFHTSILSAELTAIDFYEKLGYHTSGDSFYEDGILCQKMTKKL